MKEGLMVFLLISVGIIIILDLFFIACCLIISHENDEGDEE